MQPTNSTPQRPVMDVMTRPRPNAAPPAPPLPAEPAIPTSMSSAPLPVHEAPTDDKSTLSMPDRAPAMPTSNEHPAPHTSQKEMPAAIEPTPDAPKPKPHSSNAPSSAGIIAGTLLAMIVLAALAVLVYIKTK